MRFASAFSYYSKGFIGILLLCTALFYACSKDNDNAPSDPCVSITCVAPKTCANGTCVCPPGFTGSNCTDELLPKSVTITKVIIKGYPAKNGLGNPWDEDGSNADLTISLFLGGTNFLTTTTVIQNASPSANHEFAVSWKLDKDLEKDFLLQLLDADPPTPNPALMIGISFMAYEKGKGFPKTRTILSSDGTATAELTFNYEF